MPDKQPKLRPGRCIGICGQHHRNFTGECDACIHSIQIARHKTENIAALLRQGDDDSWKRYSRANQLREAGSNARFALQFLTWWWSLWWDLPRREFQRLGADYTQLLGERFGVDYVQLLADYVQLLAVLDPAVQRDFDIAVEHRSAPWAVAHLVDEQRPVVRRDIALKVEPILGVLTELEQALEEDYRRTPISAEPRQPLTALEALHRLSPSAFERLVADLLRAQGYGGVQVVGGANDRGVDILCRDTDGSLIAVQCKRYDPNKPGGRVGAPVVQLLSAMALQRRAHRGILVTTATFTESACKQAYDFDIELIDGEALVEQLSAYPDLLTTLQITREPEGQ